MQLESHNALAMTLHTGDRTHRGLTSSPYLMPPGMHSRPRDIPIPILAIPIKFEEPREDRYSKNAYQLTCLCPRARHVGRICARSESYSFFLSQVINPKNQWRSIFCTHANSSVIIIRKLVIPKCVRSLWSGFSFGYLIIRLNLMIMLYFFIQD